MSWGAKTSIKQPKKLDTLDYTNDNDNQEWDLWTNFYMQKWELWNSWRFPTCEIKNFIKNDSDNSNNSIFFDILSKKWEIWTYYETSYWLEKVFVIDENWIEITIDIYEFIKMLWVKNVKKVGEYYLEEREIEDIFYYICNKFSLEENFTYNNQDYELLFNSGRYLYEKYPDYEKFLSVFEKYPNKTQLKDNWERSKKEYEDFPELSKNNLQKWLDKLNLLLASKKWKLVGTYENIGYSWADWGSIQLNDNIDTIAFVLANYKHRDNSIYPLYDNKIVEIGFVNNNWWTLKLSLWWSEIIAVAYFAWKNTKYFIFREEVTQEDYYNFNEYIFSLQSWQEDNQELQKKIKEIKHFNYLNKAKKINSWILELRNIYGYSYFWSWGATGSVEAYNLAEWKEWRKIKIPIEILSEQDNWCVRWAKNIQITSNTIIIAEGYDYIWWGRNWSEIYICE